LPDNYLGGLFLGKELSDYKPKIPQEQREELESLAYVIDQNMGVRLEFVEHYMLMKIESPLIFIIGWNYIPTSHMDERRRTYTDEKLMKETINKIVDNLSNNQKSNS